MFHIVVWEEEFLQLCSRKEEGKERRRGERGRGREEEEDGRGQEEGREKKEVKNHPFHVAQQPLLPLSVGVATIVDNSIGT